MDIKRFMKLLIIMLFLKACLSAQELSFSKELLTTNDPDIKEIIELWRNNINDNIKSLVLKDNSIIAQHWNISEVNKGWIDIAASNFSSSFPIYIYGETITFEIFRKSDELYEIRSLILLSDSIAKDVLGIFKTNALKTSEGFKLSNYFYQNIPNLNKYSTKHFDYFFDKTYDFNKSLAYEADEFYQNLISKYGIIPQRRITYIVGHDLKKANNMLGFEFTIRYGLNPYAAYFLSNQGIIVSPMINHKHEITHSIFETVFPEAHRIFQEGIATFYGGSAGYEFDYHKISLTEYLSNNPLVELENILNVDLFDNVSQTNYFYTLGALFIEMALKQGDLEKVKKLFGYSSNDWKSALNEVLDINEQNFKNKINQHLGL